MDNTINLNENFCVVVDTENKKFTVADKEMQPVTDWFAKFDIRAGGVGKVLLTSNSNNESEYDNFYIVSLNEVVPITAEQFAELQRSRRI